MLNVLRFGFDKNHPPREAHFRLTSNDVTRFGTPTDDFVRRVASKIVSNPAGGDTPKMACLTNTLPTLRQVAPKLSNPENWVDNFFRSLAKRVMVLAFPSGPKERTVMYTSDFAAESKGFATERELHRDDDTDLLALKFGPWQEVVGGIPVLADIGQAEKDLEITNGFELLEQGNELFIDYVAEHYTVPLDELAPGVDFENDRPILLVNNRDGIAHGATDPVRTGKDARRDVFRISWVNERTF